MVLVVLERCTYSRMRRLHEEKLSSRFLIRRFWSDVQGRIFQSGSVEVLSLASQGALYIMTHLPVPSSKKESTLIRHIVASDDENSDTDHFEAIRLCICFVKIIIVFDLPESIFQIQRLTWFCKCVSLHVL